MLRKKQNRAPFVVACFILFHLLLFGELKITDALPLDMSSSIQEESQLSWDISTDNVAAYSVIPMLDLESLTEEPSETESNPSRQKRSSKVEHVFKAVSSSNIRSLPYYAAVRISNPLCSGTLISDSHVLTAAHCVHKSKLSNLRVGLPRGIGKFFWKKVSHIYIPKAWKKSQAHKGSKKNKNSLDADYAVLKLKHSHGQKYFKPQASKHRLKSIIRFNGYPANKVGALWQSSCPVEKVIYQGSVFVSRCIASGGSSGSGVYESLGFREYAVTGVVTASVKVRNANGKYVYSYTISNKLTAAKVRRICRWAGRNDC